MNWLWKLSSALPLELSLTSLALFKYIHREGEGYMHIDILEGNVIGFVEEPRLVLQPILQVHL